MYSRRKGTVVGQMYSRRKGTVVDRYTVGGREQ